VVQLLAGPTTPGTFYSGMRLMAIDGFTLDLADTPANDRVFGRPGNQRSKGAFPQAQVLALVESGTHVLWRWVVKGCHIDETLMAPPLLKHLQSDMLVMWDRGFNSFKLVQQVLGRQANLLARWKNNRILQPIRVLSDGSYLARIYPYDRDRRQNQNGIDVRVIEYTLEDPALPGCGESHRLLTSLLDEQLHPAKTLVELYHMRWEEELAIDEVKTHTMERPVLRSQTPGGVVQEIYGLLLAHYVIRVLMHEAALRVPTSPLRISFVGTLKILRCRMPEYPASTTAQKQWWENLLAEIGEEQIPQRRPRINPRVIKRQQSPWPKKRPIHRLCPKPTRLFRDSVCMLH